MIYASVKNTSMGKIVQDLGDVAAVRVYSQKHAGRYCDLSLDANGMLYVEYSNGFTAAIEEGEHSDTPENYTQTEVV